MGKEAHIPDPPKGNSQVTTFRLREDAQGNSVAHAASCFCPSMASEGFKVVDFWLAEADSLAELAESLEEDAIDAGEITKAEAWKMIRIGHCLEAPEGVGRRTGKPTDRLGEWERSVEAKKAAEEHGIHTKAGKLNTGSKPKPILPALHSVRMAFQETDRKPGAPATSHAGCDHAVTKSARAACRRRRQKNG